MKNLSKYTALGFLFLLIILYSCKKEKAPVITTSSVFNVTATSATSGGIITSDGGASIIANGVCWSKKVNPSITDPKTVDVVGASQFVSNISGLSEGNTYHVRAYATNSVGTAYGADLSFSTLGQAPSSLTQPATNITISDATLNGLVNANYLSTTVTFEYGLNSSYGQTALSIPGSVTGSSITTVSANISRLAAVTTYHFRVKTVNSLGTSYGSDALFTTPSTGTVSDVEGNVYNALVIGTQVWMKENLRTTKYRNGDLIGTTSPATLNITGESSPKYQWACDGNESNVSTYGRLYTWYAATDSRNVCPTDWHVPSNAEWATLATYLGGEIIAGGKLKETGTTHWIAPNTGATNEFGFTALPSGYHHVEGPFQNISDHGYWWNSTEYSTTNAYNQNMYYNQSDLYRNFNYNKGYGFSVRCLRDF